MDTGNDQVNSHLLGKMRQPNSQLPLSMVRLRPELNCMDQESETLLKALKEEYLRPPSDQVIMDCNFKFK